ncbi:MAG: flagellar hook-length control protein FliK [Lachnospiraceae bacterium]|nr:flagellar hook-length control protein FliK [Lachnospiraceae bacterium]
MGTAPISDVMSYFPSNMGVDAAGKAQQTGEIFAKAMSDAAARTGAGSQADAGSDAVKQADDTGKRIRKPDNTELKRLDQKEVSGKSKEKDNEAQPVEENTKAGKAIEEKADKIREAIKEELNITDEELELAMAELGLIPTDLLDTDVIKDLVLEISGEQDPMALLTNEGLLTSINNITDMIQDAVTEISEEFDITQEQISGIIEKMHEMGQAPEEVMPELKDTPKIPDTVKAPVKEDDDMPDTGKDDKAVRVEINRTDDQGAQVRPEQVSVERASMERKVTQMMTDRKQEDGMQDAMPGQQFAGDASGTQAVPETPAPIPVSYADTENILRQVTDHIKVDIGVDSSSMELQLHPASLGTVNLQIASSNGVITANLLVQNETVKAALESQMVKLLETFEEQGQKVEAIEVSVAGYDLDRSLSGDSGSDAGDRQDKDSGRIGRTARRRLNLNELDEEGFEDLTEEEQLAAKIMDANGTSVDYKA